MLEECNFKTGRGLFTCTPPREDGNEEDIAESLEGSTYIIPGFLNYHGSHHLPSNENSGRREIK